jgi:hypothetical protein
MQMVGIQEEAGTVDTALGHMVSTVIMGLFLIVLLLMYHTLLTHLETVALVLHC